MELPVRLQNYVLILPPIIERPPAFQKIYIDEIGSFDVPLRFKLRVEISVIHYIFHLDELVDIFYTFMFYVSYFWAFYIVG